MPDAHATLNSVIRALNPAILSNSHFESYGRLSAHDRMSTYFMAPTLPLMHTVLPDLRIAPPRLSPGVLAGVILLHAGIMIAILTLPDTKQDLTPTAPLFVRLIESVNVPPEPAPAPRPAAPQPPQVTKVPPPPVLVTPSIPLRPMPETVRPEAVRPEQLPAPVPAHPPAPVATEAPKSAPPPLLVTQPRFNADYLDNPKPPYPSAARRMGEEGEVRLRVYVDTAGNPQQIEIFRSSGFPRLDQAAQDTVRQWRFIPARQGDQPVPAWVIVPIQFNLRS